MFEYTMTDAELETVMDRTRSVSAFFREIGPKYDAENTFAYPSIKPFKESRLGAVPVGKEFGGLVAVDDDRVPGRPDQPLPREGRRQQLTASFAAIRKGRCNTR